MQDIDHFRRAVEAAAGELVGAEHRPDASYVRTPLCFPSGSMIVIKVSAGQPRFFVSDFGAAYEEASMMGASGIFARHARGVADRMGVQFDQHAFFVVEVSREQLAGAVAAIANAALETVVVSAMKIAERKVAEDAEALYQRLIEIFRPPLVRRDVEVFGKSTTKWHVTTLVRSDHGPGTIFDSVSSHHSSVFAATTKFHDIANADDPPGRVAVVRNKAEMKTFLAVLSQAANVIERDSSRNSFLQLAG